MKKIIEIFKIELILYTRDFFGFFFTFAFPVLMLLLFGSIYGNEPSTFMNGLGTMDVSVPAYSAMIVGVTGLMAFPLTLANYKDKKIYKRFDATPLGKGIMIGVQTSVNLMMTILGFALLFVVGKLVYNIHIEGNWFMISLALLVSIAAIFSIGFLFTAISPTVHINNLLCYTSYFIMIFLSGATMPKELFPDSIKSISAFLPLTHAVNVLQGTFRNAAISEYRSSMIILGGITVICVTTGAFFYKKKSWV